jgi:hypothetical protein
MSVIILTTIINRWARREGIFIAVNASDVELAATKRGFPVTPGRSPHEAAKIGIRRSEIDQLRGRGNAKRAKAVR